MRTSTLLVLAATTLICTGEFNPADARISLNQCISNRTACRSACFAAGGPAGRPFPWTVQFQYCLNHCDDNHAACVDFAMGNAALSSAGPSTKPPKPGLFDNGLLGNDHGLSPQGPAATGTPITPVTPPPRGGGVVIH